MAKGASLVHKNLQFTVHTAGDGKLPKRLAKVRDWFITKTGRTVQSLLTLFHPNTGQFIVERREDGTVEYADLLFPIKPEKILDGQVEIGRQTIVEITFPNGTTIRENEVSSKEWEVALARKKEGKPRKELNDSVVFFLDQPSERDPLTFATTYNVIGVETFKDRPHMRVRLYESIYEKVEVAKKDERKIVEKLRFVKNGNLPACLATFFDFDWAGVPKVIRDASTQQTAEMIMSHVKLIAEEGENESFPSIKERDPKIASNKWSEVIDTMIANTEGLEKKPAREIYAKDYAGKRRRIQNLAETEPDKADDIPNLLEKLEQEYDKLVNVDPLWANFNTSPFPKRLDLKISAKDAPFYMRRWQDQKGKLPRLYVAIPYFRGLTTDDPIRKELWHPGFGWWHKRTQEFSLMGIWGQSKKVNPLQPDDDVILEALEYSGTGNLERILCDRDNWQPGLITMGEEEGRVGIKSFNNNLLHRHGMSYRHQNVWRLNLTVGFKRPARELPKRILAVYFDRNQVVTWILGEERDGKAFVIKQGRIKGNNIIDEALSAQHRLEQHHKRGRKTKGQHFAKSVEPKTIAVAKQVVALAIEMGAHTFRVDVETPDKRYGNSDQNRRNSMFNPSALGKWIDFKGEVALNERLDGKWAPSWGSMSDFGPVNTCPNCRAVWEKPRETEREKGNKSKKNEDDWVIRRKGEVLYCRKCGFEGCVLPEFRTLLVLEESIRRLVSARKKRDKSLT